MAKDSKQSDALFLDKPSYSYGEFRSGDMSPSSGSKTPSQSSSTRSNYSEKENISKETNPLDDLSDHQLIDLVQQLEKDVKQLGLENVVFNDFLRKNDPQLLEEVDPAIGKKKIQEEYAKKGSHVRFGSSSGSVLDIKGPRINLTQKNELVLRAMEETQTALELFTKKSHRLRCNLKAELEELAVRESEINEAIDIFEETVVLKGVDRLTQRIPAEKFIRFMQEWLKSAQFSIERLRMRANTMRNQYSKLCVQLAQRSELAENIRAVDFEQLRIENKYIAQAIEEKNVNLLELKQMTGTANLILTKHKKQLQKQMEEMQNLEKSIVMKEKKLEELQKESTAVEHELTMAREKHDNLDRIRKMYRVPDVMDYIFTKSQLNELDKNIKMRRRKKNIQDIALNACVTEMKQITNSTQVKTSWFELKDVPSDEQILDLPFLRKEKED